MENLYSRVVLRCCGKLRGQTSCKVRFSTSSQPDKNLCVCMRVWVSGNLQTWNHSHCPETDHRHASRPQTGQNNTVEATSWAAMPHLGAMTISWHTGLLTDNVEHCKWLWCLDCAGVGGPVLDKQFSERVWVITATGYLLYTCYIQSYTVAQKKTVQSLRHQRFATIRWRCKHMHTVITKILSKDHSVYQPMPNLCQWFNYSLINSWNWIHHQWRHPACKHDNC